MSKANFWTPERRAKQSQAIQRWKPWEKSTGPKSADGKSKVGRNSYRGGVRPTLRALAKALRRQAEALKRIG